MRACGGAFHLGGGGDGELIGGKAGLRAGQTKSSRAAMGARAKR